MFVYSRWETQERFSEFYKQSRCVEVTQTLTLERKQSQLDSHDRVYILQCDIRERDEDRKSVYSQRTVTPSLMSTEECPHVQPLTARKLPLRPPGAPPTAGGKKLLFDVLKRDLQCNLAFHLLCCLLIQTISQLRRYMELRCKDKY